MREILEQANSQLWVILHHRWIALVSAFVICISGWIVIDFLPDVYEVKSKFFFDTKTVLKPLLRGLAVDSDIKEESISLIRRTLTSRPNLIKVSQDTELDLTATNPLEMERLLNNLEKNISIKAVSIGERKNSDNIYNISYLNNDPQLAKKVVDSLLNIFVESLLGITRKDSDKAEQFLDEKIEEYRLKLEEAEEKLKILKQKNAGLIPGEGTNYYSRLYQLESRLDEAMLLLREEHRKNESIKKQINELISKSKTESGEIIIPGQLEKTPLEKRIENLELKLDDLTLQYTDKHPDVITTKNALEELKSQKESLESEGPDENVSVRKEKKSSIESSKLYQEMKLMLSSSNSEIAAINARIDEYRNKIAEMKALVNVMPEVEAKMTGLIRNYEILKVTYDNLVKRRESAQISREAEQTGSEFQFNIIEPPRVPLTPVSPNRLLLATIILAVGVVGGAALAWVYEQLKPAYYRQQEIADDFDLPVYGGVSMYWSPQQITQRKAGIVVFTTLYIILFAAYGAVLLHYGLSEDISVQLRGLLKL